MSVSIKLLIVDDSAFVRSVIAKKMAADPEIEVVGTARDGLDALEQVKRLKPDVVTMDVTMPQLDGLGALERIMDEIPTAVVMLSALTGPQSQATIRALELGAVDFYLKPSVAAPGGTGESETELIQKIKVAANIPIAKLVKRIKKANVARPANGQKPLPASRFNRVVVIGSSTGGPRALGELIPDLPGNLPAAYLLVQHMPPGFTNSLAERLNLSSQITVKEAKTGDRVLPGQALVAPGGYHMVLTGDGRVRLHQGAQVCGVRPSVDVTMTSAAEIFGAGTLGVVLTGMGSDGTQGAAAIKKAGGSILVEDEQTCAVYGMPRSVYDSGNADMVLTLDKISREIASLCGKRA